MNKRTVIVLVVVLLGIGAGVWFLFPRSGAQTANASAPMAAVKSSNRVVAQGRVLPGRYAELSMTSNGVIAEVLVATGDAVKAGQSLVRLDAARPQAAVNEAQAQLRTAEAQLARAKVGATEAEIASAQAQVASAQAEYARLSGGARPELVAAAQAALKSAQANYDAAVKSAGAREADITVAQAAVDRAKSAVEQAQAAFDRVGGAANPSIGMMPQSLALQNATTDYRQALASYDSVLANAGPAAEAKIAQGAATVAQAKADLAKLTPTAEELQAAQAKVDEAKATLARLKDGPRAEDIAVAQAQVDSAKAAVQTAQAAVRDLELRAPFDGTIAWMDAIVGESASAGAPVVRIAQLATFQIRTEDLTELSLAQVRIGSPATLKFDAIPELVLPGKVEQIELVGEKKQGDITYTVVVRPEQTDERMRWNMTASVEITSD